MPKAIHTATGPNGEKFKRTSASRRYSHVVIGRPDRATTMRHIENAHAANLKRFEETQKHAAEGYEPSQWMYNTQDTVDPSRTVAERFREDGKVKSQKWLAECEAKTAIEYADLMKARALAKVEADAAKYERFVAITWCGRQDLAAKAARGRDTYGYIDIQIVEVEPAPEGKL